MFVLVYVLLCTLTASTKKIVLFFCELDFFSYGCHRTQKDAHTSGVVKSNAPCMESPQTLIWFARNGCICYIRAADDRELRNPGKHSSMLYPRAPILASLAEVRAGWAAPPEAAVTCSFLAHQGHCVRAVQAAAMTYRVISTRSDGLAGGRAADEWPRR